VFRVGDQIAETLLVHGRATRREAAAKAIELLRAVRHHQPRVARRRLPASAVGRHAPARC
jgi:peptide/nickel transport system ATP-binding protein